MGPMGTRIALAVSSATGNTALVADGVRAALEEMGWTVHDVPLDAQPTEKIVIACFWCRKGSLDPKSLGFVQHCAGKRMLLLGTMGSFPTGLYADSVRRNVERIVDERNECLGVFLCQGKVRADRIEQRRSLSPDDPHYLDDWGVARLTESLKHPNATDILYAQAFVRDHLGNETG